MNLFSKLSRKGLDIVLEKKVLWKHNESDFFSSKLSRKGFGNVLEIKYKEN